MKYYYVRIDRLNRKTLVENADWFEQCSFETVEYNEGGWADKQIRNVAPHLRFDSKQDALAYILARGGVYSEELPLVPGKDELDMEETG